jgi:hypothetical protein
MKTQAILAMTCLALTLFGCGDDNESSSGTDAAEGETGMGGAGGAGGTGGAGGAGGAGGNGESNFGAPIGEPVAIDHATVIAAIRANVTQHIDEADAALTFVEDSDVINNLIRLLWDDDEDAAGPPPGKPGDEDATPPPPGDPEDEFEINFEDLRDGLLEFLTDKVIVESTATVSDDGKTITYQLTPDPFCIDLADEGEEQSPEKIAERAEAEADCTRKLMETPVRIHVVSSGARKMNLSIRVGDDQGDGLRLQIHDDLVAVFATLGDVKAVIEAFVDGEDLELPDTMDGKIAGEIRREAAQHFTARFGILEDIRVNSPEAESVTIRLDRDDEPGTITLDGNARTIVGSLNISTIHAELPWQDIVNMFYGGEESVETVCRSNEAETESCRRYRSECLPGCAAEGNMPGCAEGCLEQTSAEVRDAMNGRDRCMESISPDECGSEDHGCREARCRDDLDRVTDLCDHREICEEVSTPPTEAPEVTGVLTVMVPGITGGIDFQGSENVIVLSNAGLGDATMTVTVNGDQIFGVDVNPDDGRTFGLRLAAQPNEHVRLELTPKLAVQAVFAVKHVREAFEDPFEFFLDETLGIRLDGAETPAIQGIGDNDDGREMQVASGLLTLSSSAMAEDVIIAEGMCMGKEDDEDLSEEEREARHDLFDGLIGEVCGG